MKLNLHYIILIIEKEKKKKRKIKRKYEIKSNKYYYNLKCIVSYYKFYNFFSNYKPLKLS